MELIRNFRKFGGVVVFASLIGTGLVSCEDDDIEQPPQEDKTIAEIVVENENFSLLEAAVVHAGLVETLSGEGPFTVFAPDNDAFAAAGLKTEEKIMALPAETVKSILLFHVLGQSAPSSSIPEGMNTEVGTASEMNLYVTKNSSGVFVSGTMVTQADVMASNGYIHAIDKVLMPPAGNIVEVAQGNEALDMLVAAVLRASEGSTDVAAVLSGDGPFTVFAPTNEAFKAAGFSTMADIQNADPDDLAAILTYHVIEGRVFSTDLTEGAMPETLNGESLTIMLEGGTKVMGNSNSNTDAANIAMTDVLATNGAVHVIDKVLLP